MKDVDETVIAQDGDDFRVVLTPDPDPVSAYDMASTDPGRFVFGLDCLSGWRVETVAAPVGDPFVRDWHDALARALGRWGSDWDRLDRWFTMLGVVRVDMYDRRSGGKYLAFVPEHLLPEWGGNADLVRESDLLTDWRALDEGDVYGYEIQRRVPWTTSAPGYDDRETWETEESVWGFVGLDHAREAAREAFAAWEAGS